MLLILSNIPFHSHSIQRDHIFGNQGYSLSILHHKMEQFHDIKIWNNHILNNNRHNLHFLQLYFLQQTQLLRDKAIFFSSFSLFLIYIYKINHLEKYLLPVLNQINTWKHSENPKINEEISMD